MLLYNNNLVQFEVPGSSKLIKGVIMFTVTLQSKTIVIKQINTIVLNKSFNERKEALAYYFNIAEAFDCINELSSNSGIIN